MSETLAELHKRNRVKKRGTCILCHRPTMWFHRKSYYHRKEKFPICAKCKKEAPNSSQHLTKN